MTIKEIRTDDLADIIAGLVKQGLTFDCKPMAGYTILLWEITLTGGY